MMSRFCKCATTSDQAVKDDRFYEYLCKQLGLSIAEKIFELCGMGEKIVSIDKPKKVEIYDPYTVEVRMYCNIDDLVRCKDCKHYQSGIDINGKPFTRCNGTTKEGRILRGYGETDPDWFCADGERRSE